MRPVDRGAAPREYPEYEDALPDLRDRLGRYCSYCERWMPTSLAVEHIRSKAHVPELRTEWTNLLLACANCNSTKGESNIDIDEYLLPDRDNPLIALRYRKDGGVVVDPAVGPADLQRGQALVDLVGLNATLTVRDLRRPDRIGAWEQAERYLARLSAPEAPTCARDDIALIAAQRGMFSIWWTVFEGDADMRRRLREAFKGTCAACFDEDENPIARPRP
ncbi:MAG: HNH endonuclease [Armatimonadetes bacterium]|nr:HNH endonuclease [Armatimonadota bacterium]